MARFELQRGPLVMIIECPHCYTSVIAKPDGTCPSCRQDTRDQRDTDPSRTSLSISMGDLLPEICYHCGRHTVRHVYVKGSRKDSDNLAPALKLCISLLSWIFLPITFFWIRLSSGGSDTLEVSLHLPQCETCAATARKPKPEFVNFAHDSMTFIVDKRFKQQVLNDREERQQRLDRQYEVEGPADGQ